MAFNKLIEKYSNLKKFPNKTALIISGIPASGKTTKREELIKKYKINQPCIIDPDEYLLESNMSYEEISEITKKLEIYAIEQGYNIVFDKVYSYLNDLNKLILLLKKHKYKIIFVLLYTDLNTALKRNKMRSRIIDEKIIKARYYEIKKNGPKYKNVLKNVNIINYYSNDKLILHINNNEQFYYKYGNS